MNIKKEASQPCSVAHGGGDARPVVDSAGKSAEKHLREGDAPNALANLERRRLELGRRRAAAAAMAGNERGNSTRA